MCCFLPGFNIRNLCDNWPWLSNLMTRSIRPQWFVALTGEKYRWQYLSPSSLMGTLTCTYWPGRQPVCLEAWGRANWNSACLSPSDITDRSFKGTKQWGLRAGRCSVPSLSVKGPRVAGGWVLNGLSNSVSWYLVSSRPISYPESTVSNGSFIATSRINRWAISIFSSSPSFNNSAFKLRLSEDWDLR